MARHQAAHLKTRASSILDLARCGAKACAVPYGKNEPKNIFFLTMENNHNYKK
jgi:hypothetical protein